MAEYLCEEDMSTGEYISRDEALKIFHQCCDNCTSSYNGVMCRACADAGAMDILIDIPAADVQPVNQWISIDERLPQDGEEALVYAGNRGVMIGLYDSVLQVWLDYECCGLKVTHWQPLPEPPKKEG